MDFGAKYEKNMEAFCFALHEKMGMIYFKRNEKKKDGKVSVMRKCFNINVFVLAVFLLTAMIFPVRAGAEAVDYSQVATDADKASPVEIGKYGMLPVYGRDIADGTYSIEVEASSSMFRVVDAQLTVEGDEMQAVLTLSGKGYLCLFMGTGNEAAASDESSYIGFVENENGQYTYTIPVEALDKGIYCAAFSKKREKWYDRVLLFDASTLPEEALLVELPDYDMIEDAVEAWEKNESEEDEGESSSDAAAAEEKKSGLEPVEAMAVDMADGEYSIEVDIAGGSGKASINSPTILTVRDGKAYATLTWSSSNYDYMIVGAEKYLNENADGGNSSFDIPIACMDESMPVIADTTAMGTPHEVSYSLTFYSESIGSKSQLPQEAAKRVVVIAIIIIAGGGVLNHFINKKKY